MLKMLKKDKTAPKATPAAKPSPKTRKRPRGALAAIGALLVASALIRVGIGADRAFAREDPSAGHVTADTAHDTGRGEQHAADAPPAMMTDADILPLIEALKAREARLNKREEDMNIRMQALSLAEQEIERKMTAMEAAEARLRETLALASSAAENDLAKLTDVYAKMKPKQAAQVFEQMDPQFAAGFMARMKPDSAASILAGMQPEKAYLISVILAGRNAEVPKE